MSKLGIYDILTSEYGEKFDKEDAQYAIDHLEADYEKNALEKAKSYAKDMHMSNDSIYDLWCLTTVKNLQNQKQNMLLSIWIIKFTDELLSRPIFSIKRRTTRMNVKN